MREDLPDQPAQPGHVAPLTPGEQSVLLAMSRGLSQEEIARELAIEKSAVGSRLQRAYEKLGVTTRLEALSALVERVLFGKPYNWL